MSDLPRVVVSVFYTSPVEFLFATIDENSDVQRLHFDVIAKSSSDDARTILCELDSSKLADALTAIPATESKAVNAIGKQLLEHSNVELKEGGPLYMWYMERKPSKE
jgi:hypothetical protein